MTANNKDVLLQSIKTIKALKNRLAQYEKNHQTDIAIIGIGCRFPGGVRDLSSFWNLLDAGKSGVIEVGNDRWSNQQFVDSDYDAVGKLVSPYAGLLERIYDFDAEFFGLSAVEAENLDPQQRLLLVQSWEALEDAGYDIHALRGSDTGVFVGIGSQDYGMALSADVQHANAYIASGNSPSMAAGRLSYFYDFTGPTMSIDTACSSSLVAVNEACRRLQDHHCQLALAAGVNAVLTPHSGVNFSRARMLTSERDCHVFDARAKGYVRGEGCGVVVLKRLSDALQDGDRIHAVIKSVAINHDGHSSGLTVPNGSAQEAVIQSALAQANLRAEDIQYVEAHGTGTSLGDPIEARALASVFSLGHDAQLPIHVGSVKANLGHLEAASGIASLIKAALIVSRSEAPPQRGFEQINPKIDWDSDVFRIPLTTEKLSCPDGASVSAGISNFGFSGTNVHAIVSAVSVNKEVHADKTDTSMTGPVVLALSAKTSGALHRHVEDMIRYLGSQSTQTLPTVSYTSTCRRAALSERIAVCGADPDELIKALQEAMRGRVSSMQRNPIVLVLSGEDDPDQLRELISTEKHEDIVTGSWSQETEHVRLHRGLLEQLAHYGVYPDQILAEGIEPAYIHAWLTGTEAPTQQPYLIRSSAAPDVWLIGPNATLQLEQPEDMAAAMSSSLVLGQRCPDFLDKDKCEFQVLAGQKTLSPALAKLFSAGVAIQWSSCYSQKYAVIDDFPKRQFDYKTFKSPRVDCILHKKNMLRSDIHPMVTHKLSQPNEMLTYELDAETPWLDFIEQHRVQGHRILPASLLIELMHHLAADALDVAQLQLSAIEFFHPVDLDLADRSYLAQVQRHPSDGGTPQVDIVLWSRGSTVRDKDWIRHASAKCTPRTESVVSIIDLESFHVADEYRWDILDVDQLYAQHHEAGVILGEQFRGVKQLKSNTNVLEGQVVLEKADLAESTTLFTLLLDSCFQISGGQPETNSDVHLLASLGNAVFETDLPSSLIVRMLSKPSNDGRCFDVLITQQNGQVVGAFSDVFFKRLPKASTHSTAVQSTSEWLSPAQCFYSQTWQRSSWKTEGGAEPTSFLSPSALFQNVETADFWAERFGLETYNAYRQGVEQFCLKAVVKTFRELGYVDNISLPKALAQCRIHESQQKLFSHLWHLLKKTGQEASVADELAHIDWTQLSVSYPEYDSETIFMQHCVSALRGVLLGEQDPLDILFRDTSMVGSDAVYLNSPISRALNAQLGQMVAALSAKRPLRILEIGAGTGGTTKSVLEALHDLPVETYCFTDISSLFLKRAEEIFQNHSFMEFQILDIEQPIAEQLFEAGTYDLIIAANVLHATRSISQTLGHVRELLAPDGYLLLRECISQQLAADLSFGMTEGWWRFEDTMLRPDYAVMSAEQWEQQLLEHDFSYAQSILPHPMSAEALIVAQAENCSEQEQWLLIQDGQAQIWVEELKQQGALCECLSWKDIMSGVKLPAQYSPDYLVCFPPDTEDSPDIVEASIQCAESTMSLCRHLFEDKRFYQTRVWGVTTQAEKVLPSDPLTGLGQSTMTGVMKSAALEYPGRIGGVIDCEKLCGDQDRVSMIQQMLSHIRQPGHLRYIAIRANQPYQPLLLPDIAKEEGAMSNSIVQSLCAGGAVLITGGFGGIGTALTNALGAFMKSNGNYPTGQNTKGTLVLVSRHIEGSSQQTQVHALENMGFRVLAIEADLSIPAQVDDVFEQIEAQSLHLEHLIHTAGIGGDQMIRESQSGDLREVVLSKLASTWYLHQRAPRDLKTFLVLSSMVGLWGAKGKAHYVFANHFADRVIQLRRSLGLAGSVVQLGPVDAGMLNLAGKEAALRVGVRSFKVQDIAKMLIGELRAAECAILDIDWRIFKPFYRGSWLQSYFEKLGLRSYRSDASVMTHADEYSFSNRFMAQPVAKRRKFVEAELFSILRDVLGLSGDIKSYLETGFHELGMDSLLTMSFAEKVAGMSGKEVSSIDVLDNANLQRLSQWLFDQFKHQLEKTDVTQKNGQHISSVFNASQPQDSVTSGVTLEQIEHELKAMQETLEDI
ncbi:SDR family NAD(P)-dependent oxidoreductase [Vibrio rhizosphaerae]|uniref:SDR family NAD(P)-dependent oxidoreductase n=1 Tax=Vibrio rhizosphaerae TaxID=398736 RepID=UPI0006896210|nr:SDR family NAD(P)-dependent oxidoreductase [Vibrio rhizosphaerae]